MATRLFRCPSTGHRVQGWLADNGSVNGDETYEGVNCLACRQVHMVNPKTGKVLAPSDDPLRDVKKAPGLLFPRR